jgi:F-type H+-transporting ATPase subunit b
MISINATLVLQVIHFLVLAFILNRLMFKPLLKLVNERTQYIEKAKNDISDAEEEAIRLSENYAGTERNARKSASAERAELRKNGMLEAEASYGETLKEVASIRSEAEREAEREMEKTKPFLRDEATALAEEIMERVIGRRIEG